MKLAIIGKAGTLASALAGTNQLLSYDVTCFGKDQYNLTDNSQVTALSKQLIGFDKIVITAGIYNSSDPWETYLVNTVSIATILNELIAAGSTAHITIAGSHGSMWTAWPGMPLERLWYNNSKKSLMDLVTSLSHSKVSKLKLTILNFSKFESSINGYTGYPIDTAVALVAQVVHDKNPPLVIEIESPDV